MESNKIIRKQRSKRAFLGKTSNFKDSKERNFEKAHLKAYLKGRRTFKHGFAETSLGIEHQIHNVLVSN